MKKRDKGQREQPEFFFVFSGKSGEEEGLKASCSVSRSPVLLSEDASQAHREKLLAQLREYGC